MNYGIFTRSTGNEGEVIVFGFRIKVYFIEPEGNIAVAWEKVKIKVLLTVKKS